MSRKTTNAARTPIERRALDAAETALQFGFPLRHQSGQIEGLALILKAFAENEIRLSGVSHSSPPPASQEEA